MSTSSTQSRIVNRRINSLQSNENSSQDSSRARKCIITHHDAYTFALRVAYLAYLLQPKSRRTQYVPTIPPPVERSSTAINELMKDIGLLKDSKTPKFPHKFMTELEKRLAGVLVGKERKPEYNDPMIKRTFAVFLNAFTESGFKKRMEKDRRVEDLVLIFFSNATKELQQGKLPGDDAWKLMVDRHLALFIRLIILVLRDHDWLKDRPDLSYRLSTLESKLLANDQDLTTSVPRDGGTRGSNIEVIVPLSYEVQDMPLVQQVARIFGLTNNQAQSDINKYKSIWTEKAALQDLKTYQAHLNLNSRKTLRNDDFVLDEGYETWKKVEVQELSQMMLKIVQSNPELAKSTTGANIPQLYRSTSNHTENSDLVKLDALRKVGDRSERSSYVTEQPIDISPLDSRSESPDSFSDDNEVFVYIPQDPRAFYRFVLNEAINHEFKDSRFKDTMETTSTTNFFSKQSAELLGEIGLRWRLPPVSRSILFLDVIRERFVDQELTVDILDAAFLLVKEEPQDSHKNSHPVMLLPSDRMRWPLADTELMQKILYTLHDALRRDLYNMMQDCYEKKPPAIGPLMYVLENHVERDSSFSKTAEDLGGFSVQLHQGLQKKAHEIYRSYLENAVPQDQLAWEFFHVLELGKSVVSLAERIQKRYRKNPQIAG